MSCRGVKFRGTIDVSNLSDENDEDDLDICVALCKDQPNTPLLELMKTSGVQEVRRVLGEYVRRLKSGSQMVDSCCGGKFQLLDGSISGQFTQLVPDKRIDMKWRFRTWPSNHYASVSLELDDRGDDTELRLECRGVPLGEEDSTREGWTRFYFRAIKQTFGY
ncbi:activator of 90 kDa heat shock protein ATPase homolog 1-like [Pelmatolapia mariae]|uniref:activator of 90 kDa heat shock protein ATPase homolog 1-like n=1 Tax=Pelmatolapia mariae TaxID=158779 RepID=UPI002FE67CB3